MRRIHLFLITGSVALLWPLAASAQRGAAPRMAPAPQVVVAPHVAAPPQMATAPRMTVVASAPRLVTPQNTSGNVTVIINNNPTPTVTNIPASAFNFIPVPGLGFDIPHLAATRGAAAVGALPGQFTTAGVGFPFFETGFFIPSAPTIVVQVPPIVIQQPVVVQQPAGAEPAPETLEPPASARRPAAVEDIPHETPRDTPEYVFVRSDGKMLFAVAYLWEKDHIAYITPDGARRSVALKALDLEATKKFNEERGLVFRLPA